MNLILALALVTSDAPVPNEQIPVAAIVHVTLALQLMDEQELDWYFKPLQESFVSDLACIQYRYQRVKDAPRVEDVWWLPPAEVCEEQASLAASYGRWAEERAGMFAYGSATWTLRAMEQRRIACVWSAAKEAARPTWMYQRRLALLELKDFLGEADFRAGRLPAALPLETFERLP